MFSLKELQRITTGQFKNIKKEPKIRGFSTDTRNIKKGDVFVALKGVNFDGREFVKDAFSRGAVFCIVEKKVPYPCLVVRDTLKALGDVACEFRKKFKIPIVSITGSNGKTTTKDLTAALLSQKFHVLKTEGNLNNLIGVPQTLFKLKKKHEIAVIELGSNQKGEIKRLVDIVCPQVGIITNIGAAHLHGLESLKSVYEEKSALFKHVLKNKGKIIVNCDDPYLKKWAAKYKKQCLTISTHQKADFYAEDISLQDLKGTQFTLRTSHDEKIQIHLSLSGEHQVANALCAAAVAFHYGVSLKKIKLTLEKVESAHGRFKIIDLGGIKLIDDTYNANPHSMSAALNYLSEIGKKLQMRTVAIVGDMFELGSHSKKFHAEIGKKISELKIDEVYGLGEDSREIVKNCQSEFRGSFSQHADIIGEFIKRLDKSTLVLVKGSRGMKMEKIVHALVDKFKKE